MNKMTSMPLVLHLLTPRGYIAKSWFLISTILPDFSALICDAQMMPILHKRILLCRSMLPFWALGK
jgi:hypothetical protein